MNKVVRGGQEVRIFLSTLSSGPFGFALGGSRRTHLHTSPHLTFLSITPPLGSLCLLCANVSFILLRILRRHVETNERRRSLERDEEDGTLQQEENTGGRSIRWLRWLTQDDYTHSILL